MTTRVIYTLMPYEFDCEVFMTTNSIQELIVVRSFVEKCIQMSLNVLALIRYSSKNVDKSFCDKSKTTCGAAM